MKTGRYSLARLLDNDNIEHIIIPEMQRDYVWTPDHVKRLLESVHLNFENRQTLSLDIRQGDEPVAREHAKHLVKEYERLRFNTRIGFIYAYYDASDSSSLYLIDGQQRITTLFLTLLALYSQLGYKTEFCERYFIHGNPKLDYKVRESAHQFLVDFIKYILEHPDGDFRADSPHYYSVYDNDPTVCSILANFDVAREWVKNQDLDARLDYVENFIEFNYFDTGLSRQGERLYLYMNSRGEDLSVQEQIHPTIVGRAKDKLAAGRDWERWQDFYWRNRGANRNADTGFMGFLKLAVILHQHINIGVYKLKREVREEYIADNKAGQQEMIYRYILEHEKFDEQWLEEVFEAIKKIAELGKPFLQVKDWLSEASIPAVNYIPLCGALRMAMRYPGISNENLYRLGMYLVNRSDADAISDQPANSTIRAMALVDKLTDEDIRKAKNADKSDALEAFDTIIWRHIEERAWEELFWSLVEDSQFNRFMDADHDLLLGVACPDGNYDLETIQAFIPKFKERLYKRKDEEKGLEMRRELLGYADFSICLSDRFWEYDNSKMELWALPIEPAEWRKAFKYNSLGINHFVNQNPISEVDPWRIALASGLEYTEKYRFLYYDNVSVLSPYIILLKKKNILDHNIRALPVQILHQKLKGSWCWAGDYHYCVLDFAIESGKFVVKNHWENDKYALDFVYHWDAKTPGWTVFLKSRAEEGFDSEIVERFTDLADPVKDNPTKLRFKATFTDTRGYLPDGSLESINALVAWVEEMKPILTENLS